MRYLLLFLLSIFYLFLISFNVQAKDYIKTCVETRWVEKEVFTRIPDNKIDDRYKQIQWRSANVKGGECLYHKSSAQCNDPLGYGVVKTIFNAQGYTAGPWSVLYPDKPFYEDYCRNCSEINAGKPGSGTQNSFSNVYDGTKYLSCQNSEGKVTTDNFDGCYAKTIERVEEEYEEQCVVYVCEETDISYDEYGAALYSCPVQCGLFGNRPARWDTTWQMYRCLFEDDIEEEEEEKTCENDIKESIDCLNNSVVDSIERVDRDTSSLFSRLLDYLDNILSNIFDSDNDDSGNDDNSNIVIDDVNIQVNDKNISSSDFIYNIFPTSISCPVDNPFSMWGHSFTFSYSKLCNSLTLVGNLVMILSIYLSYTLIRRA